MFGSATILTFVFKLPSPVKLRRAATLIFAGKSLTASWALPSKIVVGSLIFSISSFDVSKNFAPFNDLGLFVVTKVIDSNSSFTDLIPSRPKIAPDGR